MATIDGSYAQLIDRNYYPSKLSLDIPSDSDAIENRWINKTFDQLCDQLKISKESKITDVLFHLFDWSGDARDNLVEFLIKAKQKTLFDGGHHDFTILPDNEIAKRVGLTYYSLNSDNLDELYKRLLSLCKLRKYRCKGDAWIGLGGLLSSTNIIDVVVFNDQKWEFDGNLEEASRLFWNGEKRGHFVNLGKKIDENGICPCGSELKFKKCCGLYNGNS